MSHDRSLHDGKKKKNAQKSLKERRAEKKLKRETTLHARKPRSNKSLLEKIK
ncbi:MULTISPECIES: hypothetical protein [unclassified Saccharicrinis]|uniref:hypothetical protein n=1 Tax=unclassified Saccharicrinis TaxID=2646859 RepID=UPI003D351A2B